MKAPIAFAIGCIFTTLHSVSAVHCNKQHTIVDGDTCKSLSKTYNISEKVIGRLNPSVDSVCDHLEDGLKLCVGSSIKSLNKASPKTTSKKTIHTKKKMTTIIKPNKKTSKKTSKKASKKVSKKVSKKASKKASKTVDGAMPTPAARHKDPKEDTSKAQKLESTDDDSSDDSAAQPTEDTSSDDSDAQPTDDSTDASTDDSSAEPTSDSTDASDADSSAQPTDGGSDDASNDDPTPTEDSSNTSDDGSAQPTDDASDNDSAQPAQGPDAGPQPSNTTQPSNATQPVLNYFDSLTVQLTSADDFCLLLPSSPGGKKDNNNKIDVEAISKSEGSAIAFCLKKSAEKAPKARKMPEGLINSAYFFKNETADYSQVSGTINPKAYMLSPKDYGGQYDNHGKGAPANSMCYGYKYLVELIEPNTNDFCIRCCNVYEDCNAGRSAYGCQRVVSNGRYT